MKHLLYAAELIETAGLGTAGTNLFIGNIPPDVKHGIMLKDPLFGAERDDGQRDFVDHSFTVIVRDPDSAAGWDKAYAIGEALRVDHVQATGVYIVSMNPSSFPVTYPRGDADDVETSVRIHVAFGITS